jgi:FtsZ-binding cell division protein ZapB
MITLEQIRLLDSKITRAIDLIRLLKEENSTLRKGLESAQKRMKELETLVDGFKTDQKEIESVIMRTLHNLDELEESAAAAGRSPPTSSVSAGGSSGGVATTPKRMEAHTVVASPPVSYAQSEAPPGAGTKETASETQPTKEELDIF